MKETLLFLYNPCEGPGEGVFAPLLFYMVREGGSAPSGNSRTEETKPAEMSGVSGTPEGVPAGSGIISEEKLQKGYVWMSEESNPLYKNI